MPSSLNGNAPTNPKSCWSGWLAAIRPNATLCYLWDKRYPAGTSGADSNNPQGQSLAYLILLRWLP